MLAEHNVQNKPLRFSVAVDFKLLGVGMPARSSISVSSSSRTGSSGGRVKIVGAGFFSAERDR